MLTLRTLELLKLVNAETDPLVLVLRTELRQLLEALEWPEYTDGVTKELALDATALLRALGKPAGDGFRSEGAYRFSE